MMTTTVNKNNSKLFKDLLKQLKIEGFPYIISFSEDKQRDFAIITNLDIHLYDDIEEVLELPVILAKTVDLLPIQIWVILLKKLKNINNYKALNSF